MNHYYRIIDVNLNRASEALRIIEELARFKFDDKNLTEKFKTIRHNINNTYSDEYNDLLKERNSQEDVGPQVVNTSKRCSLQDILKANFKRSEQALRVLEEYSKLGCQNKSSVFELARYELYTLEKEMNSKALDLYKAKRLKNCKLYLVTDRSLFDDLDTFYDAVASALAGGVDILQLREKTATAKEFVEIAKTLKHLCGLNDTIFIINDRVDIAQAVKADGVHLGQEDIDIHTARNLLGNEAIIGLSTHKPEDAINAMDNGADYAGAGPVFTTPTKPGREAVGLEYVKWASKNMTIPFFAIGGIDETNIEEVIKAGANRIAAVRAIINADCPKESANSLKSTLLDNNHSKSNV